MKRSCWIPIVTLGFQTLGCSASGSDAPGGGNATGSPTAPSGNGASSNGSGASSTGGINLAMGGSISLTTGGTTGEAGGAADTCARDTQKAEQLPADLFILLDQSGSMTLEGNRWDPVTTALKAFIQSPTSSGL